MADNLLDKASILLTPTAYDNGSMLSVKPTDGDGDFTFSRNSSATRVNAQGLVENVQILSGDLVQNGSFSQIGTEEVSNGNFSQEGSELVTNGDFTTDSDWNKNSNWSISGNTANCDGTSNGDINQGTTLATAGKSYRITFDIVSISQGEFFFKFGGVNGTFRNSIGTYTETIQAINSNRISLDSLNNAIGSIDNVSVKEVGQDWTLGTGWSIGDGKAISDGTINTGILQENIFTGGKIYKITFDVDVTSGTLSSRIRFKNDFSATTIANITASGSYTFYQEADRTGLQYVMLSDNTATSSISNISVKEVGQDWTFGDGFTPDQANSKATCDGTQSAATNLTQTISTNIQNKLVRVSFTLDYTAGVLLGSLSGTGAVDFNNITSSGTYTAEMTSNEVSPPLILQGDANFIGSITNIVIKEVTNDTDLPRINYEGFSYQDALGSEEVVNGGFENGSASWSATGEDATHIATFDGSSLRYQSDTTSPQLLIIQGGVLVIGKTYKIVVDIKTLTSGGLKSDTLGGLVITSNEGINTFYAIATGTSFTFTRATANVDITIDNISIKEVLGQEVVPDSGCGSWLLEDESTNLVPYSEDFSQWSNGGGITITPNFGIAPNGEYVSTKIDFTSPSKYISQTTSLGVGVVFSGFVYVKGLLNETITIDIGGFQLPFVLNGEWQKYEYSDTSTSSTIGLNTFGTATATVIEVWGAQLEQQSYATSYIPTQGATSTRLQDIATDSGNSTLINSTEGVLYAEISGFENGSSLSRRLTLSNGTNGERIMLEMDESANTIKAFLTINGVVSPDEGFVQANDVNQLNYNKIALVYTNNSFKLFINGSLKDQDLTITASPTGLNTIMYGDGIGNFPFFGKTKALAVYKEALTDAELTSLTTI